MTATVRPGPPMFPRLRVAVCDVCGWVGPERDVAEEPLCRRDAWHHHCETNGRRAA